MAMTAFPDDAAAAGRRQARMMRVVNVPMRAVLSLPFPTPLSANLMLISYTGRKSGKTYRQPVSYVRDGDVLLTPGGSKLLSRWAGRNPPEFVRSAMRQISRFLVDFERRYPRTRSPRPADETNRTSEAR